MGGWHGFLWGDGCPAPRTWVPAFAGKTEGGVGDDGGCVGLHAPHLGSGPVSGYGVTFLRLKDGVERMRYVVEIPDRGRGRRMMAGVGRLFSSFRRRPESMGVTGPRPITNPPKPAGTTVWGIRATEVSRGPSATFDSTLHRTLAPDFVTTGRTSVAYSDSCQDIAVDLGNMAGEVLG